MRFYFLISTAFCVALFLPPAAGADVRLFTGNLEVVTTSGKACAGRKGSHTFSLVLGSDDTQDSVFGYAGGDTVTVGQLRGQSLGALNLRYPYPDAERAEGHTMRVEISGGTLRGELRDRHLGPAVDDCNFDLARVTLRQSGSGEAAQAAYQQLSKRYEAQLVRSTALSISRTGAHADAVHVFEQALALADKLYPPDSAQLVPYLTGLANSYMRAGRYLDFSNLYSARVNSLTDDAVRLIFSHHQIRSLLQVAAQKKGQRCTLDLVED